MAVSTSSSGCDFACLAIFDPVCASNGETFGNACEFNQTKCTTGDDTLHIVSQGACSNTSNNGSGASCLQEFSCLDVYTPVCGSDGQTYSNECFLRRAQCSNPALTMASDGDCTSKNSSIAAEGGSGESIAFASSMSGSGICTESICTKEFRPLCGSDGVTYGNECLFQNAQCTNSSLTRAFEGDCSSASGSQTSASIATPGPAVGSDDSTNSESASSETNAASIFHKSFTLISMIAVLMHLTVL